LEVITTRVRQREGVGSGDPDRGRAPNRELSDRHDDVGDRATLQLDLFVRQSALVEENDLRAVLLVPNDVLWF
jgi:hypothetical protein